MQKGDIVRGHYRILRMVGSGGTAMVWEAQDLLQTPHPVILKIVGDRALGLHESRIHSRLAHSGIPALYESFEEDFGACLVMEFVKGITLEAMVRENGPLTALEAAAIGRQLCAILSYMHELEPPVFHRDLKPSNVLKREDGRLVLLDFGSALEGGVGPPSLAEPVRSAPGPDHPGAPIFAQPGTPGYAAPEQFEGQVQADARTDVYGVCAVLHYLVTGLSPLQSGLRSVGEFVPQLKGTPLEKLLGRCLSVSPSMRCRSCGELAARLAMIERRGNRGVFDGRIWTAAMTALISAAVLGGTFCALRLGGGVYAGHKYGNYLELAEQAGDREEKFALLRQAIREEPDRAQAYERFLDVIAADGVMEDQEKACLEDCLYTASGDGRNTGTCREFFRKGDRGAYDWFILRLGLYYFAGGWIREADRFFAEAEKSPYLNASERKLAADMRFLTAGGSDGESGALSGNWEDLADEARKLSDKEGMEQVALALFRGIAVKILYELETCRIQPERMCKAEEVIGEAEEYLELTETMRDHISADLLEQTRTAVTEARNALSGEAYWR